MCKCGPVQFTQCEVKFKTRHSKLNNIKLKQTEDLIGFDNAKKESTNADDEDHKRKKVKYL